MNHQRILLAVTLLLFNLSAAAADRAAPTRWAVVVPDYFRDSGLVELLTAELSSVDDLTLLERDQIDRLTRELELSALFGDPDSPGRLALGRILGADRLLAVDTRRYRDRTTVRVLVLDMATGSRLHQSEHPLDGRNLEQACKYCVNVVEEMQTRFKDGVRAVVAVPPFISKSLDHQWKYLEAEYAQLVEHALQSTPGIAVMPMQEAMLIERELETNRKSVQRLTPLLVEGEFTIPYQEAKLPTDKVPVHIELKVSDSRREQLSFSKENLPIDQVPEFLVGRVVPSIVELLRREDCKPLSLAEQKKALLRRAARSREYGDHRTSRALKRSALLLTPLDTELRIELLMETYTADAQLHEVEFLINHRLVNMILAIELCGWSAHFQGQDRLEAWREMVLRVGPHLTSLEPARSYKDARAGLRGIAGYPVGPERVSQHYAVGMWLGGLDIDIDQGRDRVPLLSNEQILQLFDQIPPQHQRAVALGMTNSGLRSEALVRSLMERLKGRKDPHRQFALAKLKLSLARFDGSRQEKTPTADELARLEAMLDKFCAENPELFTKVIADGQRIAIKSRRRRIAALSRQQISPGQRPKQHRPYNIVAVTRLTPEEPIRIDAELAVEPIAGWRYPVVYDARNIGRSKVDAFPKTRLVQLNDTVDVVWDRQTVFVLDECMNAKPLFRKIFTASPDPEKPFSDQVLQVRGDGEKLWVATGARGILVMSTAGEILAEIDADSGLPDYCCYGEPEVIHCDRNYPDALSDFSDGMTETALCRYAEYTENGYGLRSARLTVFPLDTTRALAIGRLGPPLRTWVALVSLEPSPGRQPVQVLLETSRHQLTENAIRRALEGGAQGLDLVFEPPWICLYENPENRRERVAVVGRWVGEHWNSGGDANTPLAIDLETLQVSVLGDRLPQFAGVRSGLAARCLNGSMVVVGFDKTEAWVRKKNGDYEHLVLSDRPTQNRFLIAWGDAVYCPGLRWLRIDLGDDPGRVTEVAGAIVPPQHELNRYAASAQYKIWADYDSATRDRAYRIDPEKATRTTLSPFAHCVPRDRLDRHDRAVQAIRELGGIVERSGRNPYPREQQLGTHFQIAKGHTMVLLTDRWQGGDEGLAHLLGLHGLRTLYMQGAPITDRGAAYLNQLVEIENLFLIETEMTTRGIAGLGDLRQLQALHLEGPQGSTDFGDETLEILLKFPNLKTLGIYGAGFTGKGVSTLARMPNLEHLRAIDTSLSSDDCDRLRGLKGYPVKWIEIDRE